jgi:hypothetical protein
MSHKSKRAPRQAHCTHSSRTRRCFAVALALISLATGAQAAERATYGYCRFEIYLIGSGDDPTPQVSRLIIVMEDENDNIFEPGNIVDSTYYKPAPWELPGFLLRRGKNDGGLLSSNFADYARAKAEAEGAKVSSHGCFMYTTREAAETALTRVPYLKDALKDWVPDHPHARLADPPSKASTAQRPKPVPAPKPAAPGVAKYEPPALTIKDSSNPVDPNWPKQKREMDLKAADERAKTIAAVAAQEAKEKAAAAEFFRQLRARGRSQ